MLGRLTAIAFTRPEKEGNPKIYPERQLAQPLKCIEASTREIAHARSNRGVGTSRCWSRSKLVASGMCLTATNEDDSAVKFRTPVARHGGRLRKD